MGRIEERHYGMISSCQFEHPCQFNYWHCAQPDKNTPSFRYTRQDMHIAVSSHNTLFPLNWRWNGVELGKLDSDLLVQHSASGVSFLEINRGAKKVEWRSPFIVVSSIFARMLKQERTYLWIKKCAWRGLSVVNFDLNRMLLHCEPGYPNTCGWIQSYGQRHEMNWWGFFPLHIRKLILQWRITYYTCSHYFMSVVVY